MNNLSVVIICKNEEDVIGKTLQSLGGLTDDVIVYDNGSTDNSLAVVRQFPVRLEQGSWEGFGATKRKAIALARHDWILSLDADEALDEEIRKSLQQLQPENDSMIYEMRFRNFLGEKYLRYGEWGNDRHIRLFNRNKVNWDDAPVHEQLRVPAGAVKKTVPGYILHRTMKDLADYSSKMRQYALLNAEKYRQQGKKVSGLKLWLAPGFSFFRNYILKGGFLDGHAGYICARMTAWYTFLKYARLKELNKESNSLPHRHIDT